MLKLLKIISDFVYGNRDQITISLVKKAIEICPEIVNTKEYSEWAYTVGYDYVKRNLV